MDSKTEGADAPSATSCEESRGRVPSPRNATAAVAGLSYAEEAQTVLPPSELGVDGARRRSPAKRTPRRRRPVNLAAGAARRSTLSEPPPSPPERMLARARSSPGSNACAAATARTRPPFSATAPSRRPLTARFPLRRGRVHVRRPPFPRRRRRRERPLASPQFRAPANGNPEAVLSPAPRDLRAAATRPRWLVVPFSSSQTLHQRSSVPNEEARIVCARYLPSCPVIGARARPGRPKAPWESGEGMCSR